MAGIVREGELVVVTGGGPGGGDSTIIDGVTPTIKATVFDRVNSNPLAIQLVDSNGDLVSTFPISAASLPYSPVVVLIWMNMTLM